MSKQNAPNNVVFQYRSGEWVGTRVLELAGSWKVTHHEAARRLMMLAMFRLTVDHYPAIEQLANAVGGGNNFLRACDMVLAALTADELSRKESKRKPRTEQERVAFIERWVQQFSTGGQRLPGAKREAAAVSDQAAQEQPGATPEDQPAGTVYRKFNLQAGKGGEGHAEGPPELGDSQAGG